MPGNLIVQPQGCQFAAIDPAVCTMVMQSREEQLAYDINAPICVRCPRWKCSAHLELAQQSRAARALHPGAPPLRLSASVTQHDSVFVRPQNSVMVGAFRSLSSLTVSVSFYLLVVSLLIKNPNVNAVARALTMHWHATAAELKRERAEQLAFGIINTECPQPPPAGGGQEQASAWVKREAARVKKIAERNASWWRMVRRGVSHYVINLVWTFWLADQGDELFKRQSAGESARSGFLLR